MSKREFNPKAFFRKLNPKIRDRLVGQLGLFEAASAQPNDAEISAESTYHAWAKADSSWKRTADRDLIRINDLACDNARYYLNEAAARLWTGQPERLAESLELANADLAVAIFLESRPDFDAVYADFSVDDFSFRVMRRGAEPRGIEPRAEHKDVLKPRIAGFFRDTLEGGRQVQIEDHFDGTRFALFIYHEDRQRYEDGFERDGRLVAVPRRPVVQAMTVYYPASGLLTVKSRLAKVREQIIVLIGEIYFGDPSFFAGRYQRDFDFSPLNRPDFEFAFRAGEGIGGVRVTEFAFEHPSGHVGVVIAQCPGGNYREAIIALNADPARVIFRAVKILVLPDGRMQKRRRTIALEAPNRWNLNDTPRDRKLVQFLETNGLIGKSESHDNGHADGLVVDAERLQEDLLARVAARYGGPDPTLAP